MLVCLGITGVLQGVVSAGYMTSERLTLQTSQPSAVGSHSFQLVIPSSANVGSIEFEYCANDPFQDSPCIAPADMDISGASLDSQSGATGFAIDASTTPNRMVIGRLPVLINGPQTVNYVFSNVVNPSASNQTFYVRIATFASTDGTGAMIDIGALAFSTSGSLSVGGYVPPYLTFCVGVTVEPRCEGIGGSRASFGQLSSAVTRSATSQFAGATNYGTGYVVSVLGTTLTSGNNTITALSGSGTSTPGVSQFGLNLADNSVPDVGQSVTGGGSATPRAAYAGSNQYRFVSGETIASSPLATDFNRFTVSYIANVSSAQAPGVYATTLKYVAFAGF